MQDEITITFSADENLRYLYESLGAKFHQQYPHINIQFVSLPQTIVNAESDYYQLASSADTTLLSSDWVGLEPYFRDLAPWLDADATFSTDDFWPHAIAGCQDAQGRLLGVPVNIQMWGIFYNPAAFDSAGLSSPQLGWTWDDFRDAVIALAKLDGDKPYYGYAEPYNTILRLLIADHLAVHNGELDSEQLAREIQWYIDLAQAGAIDPIQFVSEQAEAQKAWDEWQALFKDKADSPAMWADHLFASKPGGGKSSAGNEPFAYLAIKEYGFVPYPVSADQTTIQTTPITVQCASVSTGSLYPDAAWTWVNFLSYHATQPDQAEGLQALPARQSVTLNTSIWQALPVDLQQAISFGLEHGWQSVSYSAWINAIEVALSKTLAQKTNLSLAFDKAIAKMTAMSQATPDTRSVVVATPLPPPSSSDGFGVNYYHADGQEFDAVKTLADEFNQSYPDTPIMPSSDSSDYRGQPWFSYLAGKYDCFLTDALGGNS